MNSGVPGGRAYAREAAVYREMTPIELERARSLVGCKLPPASMTKRFAGQVAFQVKERRITEKQAAYLAVCCYRFRRQLCVNHPELVPMEPPPGYETPGMRDKERRRLGEEEKLRAMRESE